jgi:septum formation topological specificity factor MinE
MEAQINIHHLFNDVFIIKSSSDEAEFYAIAEKIVMKILKIVDKNIQLQEDPGRIHLNIHNLINRLQIITVPEQEETSSDEEILEQIKKKILKAIKKEANMGIKSADQDVPPLDLNIN